jgi:hypothetical protein
MYDSIVLSDYLVVVISGRESLLKIFSKSNLITLKNLQVMMKKKNSSNPDIGQRCCYKGSIVG